MSDPYDAPPGAPPPKPPVGSALSEPSPLVQQVRVVTILSAVAGGLEILMSLVQCGVAVMMIVIVQNDPGVNNSPGPSPEVLIWIIAGLYLAIALALVASGVLRIVASLRTWHFRGRVLAIVSLGVGMVSMITMYCAPISIGLLVYGLVVYLNPSVKAAFEQGESGVPADDIIRQFNPQPPRY